jgi:hypothetical protein
VNRLTLSPEEHENLKVCDCAECGTTLLGPSEAARFGLKDAPYPFIAGRIKGRPYCVHCLYPQPTRKHGGVRRLDDEGGPAWENMIRTMEGG